MSDFANFGKYCREHRSFENIFYYVFFVIGFLLLFIYIPIGAGIMIGTWVCYDEDKDKPYG